MAENFKKVVIAAGGSGGHLYPATGLAKQLQKQRTNIDLLFVGAGLDNNLFFDRNQFTYQAITSGTLGLTSPFTALRSCKNILLGYFQSRQIIKKYHPNLVIGFGSYHSFPLLLAAQSLRIPIALHEQNSKPGKVIRFFSKKALLTGVYFSSAMSQLKGKCIELAMPLREGYKKENCTKEFASAHFGLDSTKMTVLVFGGSQGAMAINQLVSRTFSYQSLQRNNFQILHFTGDQDEVYRLQIHYQSLGISSVVKKFEERMELAWRAADFCIARSGAGTIAELLEFEVPAILIPYPYAADGHQESNADYLVDIVGGGWKFLEHQIHPNQLASFCKHLLSSPHLLLMEKRNRLKLYQQQACRREFASVIVNLLEGL